MIRHTISQNKRYAMPSAAAMIALLVLPALAMVGCDQWSARLGRSQQAEVIRPHNARRPAPTTQPAGADRGDQNHLGIWDAPQFRKRFVESYIAETEVEPRVTADEREQLEKIMSLISADKMQEATELLGRQQGAGANAVFDFTLGNVYFTQDKLEQAVACYRRAVEKYPKFRRAWRNLGVIHVRRSDFDQAAPALVRVIELGSGDAIVYGLLGFSHAGRGNSVAAESAYRMAILLDPETTDWKMGLARSFFRQERYGEAVALCDQLIENNPQRAELWLLQANAYIGMAKPLKAAENYEFVDRLGESTVESLNTLADIYVNEGLFAPAVDSYIRAMEMALEDSVDGDAAAEPAGPKRAMRAAKVMTARGAHEQTKRLVERIDALHGDRLDTKEHKELLKLRARIALAEGAGDEELHALKRIVELDPLDGEALILLGKHYARAGDVEQAIFYYERAAGIEEFEAEAKLRHGQALVKEGRYSEALPLLRKAQKLDSRDDVEDYIAQVERIAKSR